MFPETVWRPCGLLFKAVIESIVSDDELLTPAAAAVRLGLARTTLYAWLGLSRRNLLEIHGRRVTIDFLQTGPKAQGRIRITAREVERIRELLRVQPIAAPLRRSPTPRLTLPHITVPLGRPDRP